MNEHYGYVREQEAELLDETLVKLKVQFAKIAFLEIGVFGAGTVRGVYRRGSAIQCPVQAAGVDWEDYRPKPTPAPDYQFYAGDCMDMWRQVKGEFNLLFVDGCHCVNHSMCDFLNYSPFVVVGGYALFHDTAVPKGTTGVDQGTWPQNHSYAGQAPSVLGVREGLKKIGLLQGYRADWKLVTEIPSDTGLMGMMLFQKLKAL